MRLLNTETFLFHEFLGTSIPPYAILSHTWGAEEVSYHEWAYAHEQPMGFWGGVRTEENIHSVKRKGGYGKILKACERAQRDGFQWLWVDTICIDKSSSAELSEAINSMFRWYEKSQVCYAYLVDVPALSEEAARTEGSAFYRSSWFTRGWTLQELIAPARVEFYSSDWTFIASKESLASVILSITGVPKSCLGTKKFQPRRHSIATKFSWASKRQTSRTEDTAYCLLGVMNVNMTLIYGEGESAFMRLQQELIRRSTDQSILAWDADSPFILNESHDTAEGISEQPGLFCTGLARTPAAFVTSSRIFDETVFMRPLVEVAEPHSVSSLGLCGYFRLVDTLEENFKFAVLTCVDDEDNQIWMPLRRYAKGSHHFTRLLFPMSIIRVPHLVLSASRYKGPGFDASELHFTRISIDVAERALNGQDIFLGYQEEYNKFARPDVNGSTIVGVVLTFPQGNQSYRIAGSFPTHQPHRLAFELHTDPGSPPIAHGILRLTHGSKEAFPELDLLFAACLDENGLVVDWTCRIIRHANALTYESQEARSRTEARQLSSWPKLVSDRGCAVSLGWKCYGGEKVLGGLQSINYQCLVAQVYLSRNISRP